MYLTFANGRAKIGAEVICGALSTSFRPANSHLWLCLAYSWEATPSNTSKFDRVLALLLASILPLVAKANRAMLIPNRRFNLSICACRMRACFYRHHAGDEPR